MINELYQLTVALDQANIETEDTFPKYKEIPKVTAKAPCVQIILNGGHVERVCSLGKEQAAGIRRYGSNQGMFPAMNLMPLYRLTDKAEKEKIKPLLDGKTVDFQIEEIRKLCRENNWGEKFRKKYIRCIRNVPAKITELFQDSGTEFWPIQQLIEETRSFQDTIYLHKELERVAFTMLERKRDIVLALQILFYFGKKDKNKEEDGGTLSVVLDSRNLITKGWSVATYDFTSALNKKLVEADAAAKAKKAEKSEDAFGKPFEPLEEPMPTVKLAAGFDVTIRTMFRGQPCQSRYGRIGNATYPISKKMRFQLQAALDWIGKEERRGITWISTDKDEALFAYPEKIRENMYSQVDFIKPGKEEQGDKENGEKDSKKSGFETAAKQFISEVKRGKEPGTDPKSERIQYFVLRKWAEGRTKVVYTYNASPVEIERCCENWSSGCRNLPKFQFGSPAVLFPIKAADILNISWKQDGNLISDKIKSVPHYHGIQLLFGTELTVVRKDLFDLMKKLQNLAPYLGKTGILRKEKSAKQINLRNHTLDALALTGLLLYQLGIRREKYMQEFPYLFGQLLQVSDALHEMYCKVVRNNDVPNTLAGSGLYVAGLEQPYRTLGLLGQRMNPYIAWAKSYRTKAVEEKGTESWRAAWYLSIYQEIATQLASVWGNQTSFNEEEKAQYFIGYLAAFPSRKEKTGGKSQNAQNGNDGDPCADTENE